MNVIFLTQSNTLSLFYNLLQPFREKTEIDKVGFYIADSRFYNTFQKQHPEISSGSFELLKEWEIISRSKKTVPDIERLRKYEERLGDPVLWNAIVADRRIYLGKKATIEQDYSKRFTHEEMLSILQVGIEEIEAFFDRVQPDAVIGYICVTIGEYLAYLVARSRNIVFLNLRPTRIKNYFFAGENIFWPSDHLNHEYKKISEEGIPKDIKEEVSSFLDSVRKTHSLYEGILPSPDNVHRRNDKKAFAKRRTGKIFQFLSALAKQYYDYNFGEYRYDNHHRGIFYPIWFQKVKRPIRTKMIDFLLKGYYIPKDRLVSMDYAFYPLHKEPEVTLLVYSRPYLNQIEVIRNFARSLPAGMKLIVKEHPASVGYRPISYYKKLLSIPNVFIAHPRMTSRELVQNAKMVFIISGSVGFEAIMMKKPVIHFGNIPFSMLPDNMVRHVKDLDHLGWEVHDILKNHKHDEEALIAYIASVMNTSVHIDFYSVLLGFHFVLHSKRGTYRVTDESIKDTVRIEQINRLADYILERYQAIKTRCSNMITI